MAKKLYVQDNQRVDRGDFERAANDYTFESVSSIYKNLIGKNFPAVVRGFQVSILPGGQVTVYNGFGYDKDGRVVLDEDGPGISASVTLSSPSTTYYIEVEYTETPSDTDYRAFFDPSVQNTPPLPNGQEVSLTTATRITPKWRIVSPVSTVGFEIDSNPNSTRIPVAVLTTDAFGEITSAVNHFSSLLPPVAKLEEDAPAGSTILKTFSSLNIMVGDSIIIESQNGLTSDVASVTNNDLDNGIITINAPLSNSYESGDRVRVTGTAPVFLPRNTNPNDVDVDNPNPQLRVNDQVPRLFQGDELRGSGLVKSAENLGTRDDLSVSGLKDYVDYLAALIREMKFGNLRPNTMTSTPPATPSPTLRYYDNAGSIMGARGYTFTIGDGTNSFGDFNGTDETPFNDAMANLPANGGTILVKRGTYTVDSCVLTKSVTFVGEHKDTVIINGSNVSGECFVVADNISLGFHNITVASAYPDKIISVDNSSSTVQVGIDATESKFSGAVVISPAVLTNQVDAIFTAERCEFNGCRIEAPYTAAASLAARFFRCSIVNSNVTCAASRVEVVNSAVLLDNGSKFADMHDTASSFSASDSYFSLLNDSGLVAYQDKYDSLSLTNCEVYCSSTLSPTTYAVLALQCQDGATISGCSFTNRIINNVGFDNSRMISVEGGCSISDCSFTTIADNPGDEAYAVDVVLGAGWEDRKILLRNITTNCPNSIRNPNTLGSGKIYFEARDCVFDNDTLTNIAFDPISITSDVISVSMHGCTFKVDGTTQHSTLIAVSGTDGITNERFVDISDCKFIGVNQPSVAVLAISSTRRLTFSRNAVYGFDIGPYTMFNMNNIWSTLFSDNQIRSVTSGGQYLANFTFMGRTDISRNIIEGSSDTASSFTLLRASTLTPGLGYINVSENKLYVTGSVPIEALYVSSDRVVNIEGNFINAESSAPYGPGVTTRGIYAGSKEAVNLYSNNVRVLSKDDTSSATGDSYCVRVVGDVSSPPSVSVGDNTITFTGTVSEPTNGKALDISTPSSPGAFRSVSVIGNIIKCDHGKAPGIGGDVYIRVMYSTEVVFSSNTVTINSGQLTTPAGVAVTSFNQGIITDNVITSNTFSAWSVIVLTAFTTFSCTSAADSFILNGNYIKFPGSGLGVYACTLSNCAESVAIGNRFESGNVTEALNVDSGTGNPPHHPSLQTGTYRDYNYDNGL